MIARLALCATVLLTLSTQAHALCRDELKDMKPRIDALQNQHKARYFQALKWWGKAMEAEKGSEVECLNYLAHAQRAINDPDPQIADCTGPNAYLPQCQNGGYGAVQPTMAVTNDPFLGLNGTAGGGGAAVQPQLPVTEAPPPRTSGNGGNPEATGTGRTN